MSLTVASLAMPVLTLSIGDAVTRYIIDDMSDGEQYASIGFWVTLAGCLAMFLILPLINLSIFGGLGQYRFQYMAYFTVMTFNSYLTNVSRGFNKVRLITWASIISSLVSGVLAGILIGLLKQGINGYFISLTVGGLTAIVIYLIVGGSHRYISLPKKTDSHLLRNLLYYSIPLMPNSVFWWIGNSVNRFFITGTLGIAASGLFAAASKIPNLMNLISSTFWQAWSLSAFQEFKRTDTSRFYSNVFVVFRVFCFFSASALILLSPWLASILLQKQFYQAWPIIPILVLAFLFNVFAGFYGTVFTASMRTKYLFTTTMVAAAVVVVATWLLIHPFGLSGAAWAMVLSNLIMCAMRVHYTRSILRINVNWLFVGLNILLVVMQTCIMVSQMIHYRFLSVVLFGLVCVTCMADILPTARNLIQIVKDRRGK